MRKQCVEGRSTSTSTFGSNGNKFKMDPPKRDAIQEIKIQKRIDQSHHANSVEFSSICFFEGLKLYTENWSSLWEVKILLVALIPAQTCQNDAVTISARNPGEILKGILKPSRKDRRLGPTRELPAPEVETKTQKAYCHMVFPQRPVFQQKRFRIHKFCGFFLMLLDF